MCAPVIGILAAGLSAAGAMQQANAQAAQAKYNSQVEEINARTARQEGQLRADKLEDQYQSQRAEGRVSAAKSGLNPAAGSAALVIDQESFRNQRADELATIWNSETQAVGHENKATGLRAEAKAYKQAGMIGAASTFLGGLKGTPFKLG